MYTVYGMNASGNCYKVKLALEWLGIAYKWVEIDILNSGTRTPEFLAMNPNGKVPTLALGDGNFLPESNAILHYLAEGTPLMPRNRLGRARALQWMFFEQYSHEPYIAVARFITLFLPPDHARRAELPRLRERGGQALRVMETELTRVPYFAGEDYSIADIALFAYTHCADQTGFDLAPYPKLRAWLARVRAQPGFVPMDA